MLGEQAQVSDLLLDLFTDVSSLLRALEGHGHDIEGYGPADPSHPIVTSRFKMFALRRSPPTVYTPYAEGVPVLRIPYVWFDVPDGGEVAVVMLIGDKTRLGNAWYPRAVRQIERVMMGEWRRRNPTHQPQLRGSR